MKKLNIFVKDIAFFCMATVWKKCNLLQSSNYKNIVSCKNIYVEGVLKIKKKCCRKDSYPIVKMAEQKM